MSCSPIWLEQWYIILSKYLFYINFRHDYSISSPNGAALKFCGRCHAFQQYFTMFIVRLSHMKTCRYLYLLIMFTKIIGAVFEWHAYFSKSALSFNTFSFAHTFRLTCQTNIRFSKFLTHIFGFLSVWFMETWPLACFEYFVPPILLALLPSLIHLPQNCLSPHCEQPSAKGIFVSYRVSHRLLKDMFHINVIIVSCWFEFKNLLFHWF